MTNQDRFDRFKFRVWSVMHEEYRDPSQFVLGADGLAYVVDEHGCLSSSVGITLQMCTGLRDRNGTLIYEGDVVKNDSFVEPAVVEFQAPAFTLEYTPSFRGSMCASSEHLEVLGNIFENPELLKDE